jgi:TolB-like protein/Flp pilus assembly protein TadD
VKLFSELRRRNVLRMGALYLGAAWLVMQVVDILIDRGPLPESLGPITLTVLMIGFPIALILSWFYEVTPEGVTFDEDVKPNDFTPVAGRRLDFVVIAVLSAAVLMFAWDKWWTGPPPERSVAVLPFVNVSGNSDYDHLGIGFAEAILNELAQLPDARITSLTSVLNPRLEGMSVKEVAALLGVATVLEGSVQRQGDRLRVTAQLINAADDDHLWSKNFDGDFSNTFAIQDEVSEAVASVFQISVRDEVKHRIDREGTDNLAAFEEYSKAIDNLRVRTTDSVFQAIEQLQRAIEFDPNFARAHAMLGHAYREYYYRYWSELSRTENDERARAAANTALQIAPGMPMALALLGDVTEDNNVKEQLYREAVTNGPNDTYALRSYADYLWDKFQTDEALELAEKLTRLDPLDDESYFALAWRQNVIGRTHEALQTVARGKDKLPGSVSLLDMEYNCYLSLGEYSSMIRAKHETLAIDPKEYVNRWVIAMDYLNVGLLDEAERWYERAAETAPENDRDDYHLMWRTSLDVYYQRNDEEVFESLQQWVTGIGWQFAGFEIPHYIFIEYGDRLDRLDEVLSTFEGLAPHLFTDPPDLERDVYWTSFVGRARLRVGDQQRGEPLAKYVLNWKQRRASSGKLTNLISDFLYLGRIEAALDEFRSLDAAVKFDYGGLGPRFLLQYSPVWAPVRATPEYDALMQELDRNIAMQREKLQAMDLPVM